jgi:hypothetical protein
MDQSTLTTPENTPTTPGPSAPYPLHRRVIDVFVAPGKLFSSFDEGAPWIGALLLACALAVITVLLVPVELYIAQAEQAMADADVDMAPGTIAAMTRVFGVVGGLIGQVFTTFVIAGFAMLVFTVLLGGKGNFVQQLAVTTHSLLILAIGGLITVPLIIATGDLNTGLSLALFAPFLEEGSFVHLLLRSLTVFSIWTAVVMGLGFSIVSRKVSWGTAAGILLVLHLALSAVGALIAGRAT